MWKGSWARHLISEFEGLSRLAIWSKRSLRYSVFLCELRVPLFGFHHREHRGKLTMPTLTRTRNLPTIIAALTATLLILPVAGDGAAPADKRKSGLYWTFET